MNPDSSETRIPLSLDINTASLSQAQQAAERFEGTVEDLRTQLERLRAQAVATFTAFQQSMGQANRAPISTQGAQVSPYEHMLSTVQRNPGIAQAVPDLGPALHQIARMEQQLATGAVTGSRPAPPPMAGPPPGADSGPEAATTKETTRTAARRPSTTQRPRPFSERLSENVLRARPLTVAGAFAHGDYTAGGRSIARAFLETMATDVRYARALSRGALGTAASSAATAAGGAASGGAGGAAEGAMSAGAAGATGAGEASLIGRLGALVTGPVALIGAGIAAIAGAGLYLDKVHKQVAGQEYLLRGNVGGIGSTGDVGAFLGHLGDVGSRYMYKTAETVKTADTLGAAGVTAGQMPGAVGNSMAFARTSGQDLSRVTALTSQLMVQGGMSATQVGSAYSQLQAAADQSGQSVAKLVTSLEDLLRTTGGGAQQINGLAAVQSILGPSVGAAQAVGQPMMATGARAINTAGMLGISTERLQRIQDTGNGAQMFDLVAATARKWAGGKTDQTTIDYVESAMQAAGLLDLTGTNPKNATRVVGAMIRQGPRAAEQLQEQRQRDDARARAANGAAGAMTDAQRAAQLGRAGDQAAGAIADAGLHIAIQEDIVARKAGLFGNNINAVADQILATAVRLARAHRGDARVYVSPGGPPRAWNGIPLPGATPTVYSTMPLLGAPISSGTYNLPKGGTRIPNSRGGFDTMDPTMFRQVVQAATRYKVPVALLMAELAKESDLNPGAERHNGPGDTSYGVAQFTPQALDALRKRKGSPIFGMTQAQALAAAKNPGQAIPLAAYYNRQLYDQHGSSWQDAASAYNGSAAYGAAVMASSGQIMQTLHAIPASGPSTPAHPTAATTTSSTHQLTVIIRAENAQGNHLATKTFTPPPITINHGRTPLGHRPVAPRPAIPHGPTPAPRPAPGPAATPTPTPGRR